MFEIVEKNIKSRTACAFIYFSLFFFSFFFIPNQTFLIVLVAQNSREKFV